MRIAAHNSGTGPTYFPVYGVSRGMFFLHHFSKKILQSKMVWNYSRTIRDCNSKMKRALWLIGCCTDVASHWDVLLQRRV